MLLNSILRYAKRRNKINLSNYMTLFTWSMHAIPREF